MDLRPEDLEKRDAYLADREGFLKSGKSIFSDFRIDQFSKSWHTVVTKGRREGREFFGENYLEIRYESLLHNPHSELDRLFRFLEVSRESSTVGRIVEDNRFEKRSSGRSRGEEDSSSFMRKGIHGDWKEVFNEQDKKVFKEQTGGLLVALGYEKDVNW